MVKPKNDPNKNWLFEELERASERLGKVVAERFYVIEFTPGGRYHDGYDYTWARDKSVIVSPYFKTRDEAEAWQNEHVADDGSELRVKRQELRERVVREWFPMGFLGE